MFAAFKCSSPTQTKVVIIGQDPYHGERQAMGLAFSVKSGVSIPPSVVNVLREADAWPAPHGDLTAWAQQGVLLLNACLTVVRKAPASHSRLGWADFTDGVIRDLCAQRDGIIFMLWGNFAKAKRRFVTPAHHVLAAAHPSPLAAVHGFRGCRHFQKANEILAGQNSTPIDWRIQ